MPIAPLVAAVRRRLTNLPGPLRGSGEASNDEPVQVELWVAGEWVDITSYCMVRDDSGQIRITYGIQGSEGSQTERATATLQLKNQDGRFSPRNPSGPYYGSIGRNTPLRISVPDGNGGKAYRLWGEVTEWAPNWDPSGSDVWVDVTVAGILQRLAQGPAPERSVVYRAITEPLASSVVAYWPCEDADGSTQIASAVTSGSPMTFSTGTPDLAASTRFAASDPLPVFTGAAMSGGVSRYDTPTATQVRFFFTTPSTSLSDRKVIMRVSQAVDTSTTPLAHYELVYNATTRSLSLIFMGDDGTNFGVDLDHTFDIRNKLLYVSLEFQESGSSTIYTIRTLDVLNGVESSTALTRNTEGLTRCTAVHAFVASISAVGPNSTTGLTGGVLGHITVENAISDIDALGARLNPIGETAGRRIQRLCGEEAIPFEWVGDLDDTVRMGAQGKANPLTLIQEAVLADGGLLYETRSALGLGYRTRASLYNQDPALILSYSGYNLAAVPVPVEDDRTTQNVLTVTAGGVSETYEETDGPLGTQAIGKYGESSGLTLNLATTDRATIRDHAAWRVHLGTTDEERFPRISVNLAHPSITPDMRRAILALRLGDRIQITNPPAWLAPDTIDQLILGIDPETINHFEQRLTFACAPASPYTVGYLDDETRIDTDGSVLVSAVGSSDTSLVVAPSPGEVTLWTTSSADWPFDIRVGGEVMRVTAVSGAVSDTFTRTTSNGWGTADTGQSWTNTGGAASEYATNGTQATHSPTAVNSSRFSVVPSPSADVDVRVSVSTAALATGDSQYAMVLGRYMDANNTYGARLDFRTDQTLRLVLQKRVGGAQSDLSTTTIPGTHAASTFFTIRFQVKGARLRAKAWATSEAEPDWQSTVTDGSLSTAGSVGVRSVLGSGNTNVLPLTFTYDNFQLTDPQTFTVTRSVNGVVKAHSAGADVRLANPWILPL
ncbi:hypothetical protein [Streptomyces sp. XY006]|uniref:hypothetical protein n=1 Tax=Streptomyces sp. XY006 TaxID=2021410 RepID=UPI000B8BF22B|nr:hypothetical protein [Streptomyces sp. XY006]OXS35376.1 hypothetical protein CHR28_10230 [Streptomyces sp. XY006]